VEGLRELRLVREARSPLPKCHGQRRSISCVKRLRITIEDDLYDLLTLEAYRTETSKAAVVRDCLRERLRPTLLPPIEEDRCGSSSESSTTIRSPTSMSSLWPPR
jgi:Arc/MetJ family transcription regulator